MNASPTETYVPASSTNIGRATHDRDAETLEIEFQNGDTYVYSSVPYSVFVAFQRAGSAGSFFARQIKGRYPYELG